MHARKRYWYDNNTLQVYEGITGWCYTLTFDGKKYGDVGFSSSTDALKAARSLNLTSSKAS